MNPSETGKGRGSTLHVASAVKLKTIYPPHFCLNGRNSTALLHVARVFIQWFVLHCQASQGSTIVLQPQKLVRTNQMTSARTHDDGYCMALSGIIHIF